MVQNLPNWSKGKQEPKRVLNFRKLTMQTPTKRQKSQHKTEYTLARKRR